MTSKPSQGARRTPTDDELPCLLAALEASGGNIAAFAREQGLRPWKLYEAQRLAGGGGRRGGGRRKAEWEFAPVHILAERPGSSAPLEVVVGLGHRLLIRQGFDETTLRRLIGVLSSC
jgi:hypothetical protein